MGRPKTTLFALHETLPEVEWQASRGGKRELS
jgi:hypothetical protein